METLRSFETSTFMALGPTMESLEFSRSCKGKKPVGAIFWEFHDGVLLGILNLHPHNAIDVFPLEE